MSKEDEIKTMEYLLHGISKPCPSCGLHGKQRCCPKCGRNACDLCIAFDNSDCIFCGPNSDIAKEIFTNASIQI